MTKAYELTWIGKKRGKYTSLAHTTTDMAAAYNYKADLQKLGYAVTLKELCDKCLLEICKCKEWSLTH